MFQKWLQGLFTSVSPPLPHPCCSERSQVKRKNCQKTWNAGKDRKGRKDRKKRASRWSWSGQCSSNFCDYFSFQRKRNPTSKNWRRSHWNHSGEMKEMSTVRDEVVNPNFVYHDTRLVTICPTTRTCEDTFKPN